MRCGGCRSELKENGRRIRIVVCVVEVELD